jgi:hypothetical protein
MDFTIKKYQLLLKTLVSQDFFLQTFLEFLQSKHEKAIILRHDVDRSPLNTLQYAIIQAKLGIKGSYYFRAVPESWDESIILNISDLGHEIGYHYETMDTANGDIDKAWDQFRYNLDELRKLADIKTICMHGSPRSKFDNKDIWKRYDYRTLGIIGEPYYDINYNEVFYLTDTGRQWDGWKTAVRDKVPQQKRWIELGLVFHSTDNIIEAIEESKFPDQAMLTFHPQRWHDKRYPWVKELLIQSIKNQVKKSLYVK